MGVGVLGKKQPRPRDILATHTPSFIFAQRAYTYVWAEEPFGKPRYARTLVGVV